jgi:hypothetical protein
VLDELFHEGGQTDRLTDMTNLIVGFRNFAYVPKIIQYFSHREKNTLVAANFLPEIKSQNFPLY